MPKIEKKDADAALTRAVAALAAVSIDTLKAADDKCVESLWLRSESG